MTTYRKEVKEHRAFLNQDSYNIYKVRNELWTRTNCLLGFTVISILIGCVALAISILLLLQSFEVAGLENAKVAALEMRIKSLEQLTEHTQPQREGNNHDISDFKGAPTPATPSTRQPRVRPPPPSPPSTQPVPKQPHTEISRDNGGTKPELPSVGEDEENERPGNTDKGTGIPPYIPSMDDDEDSYGGFEGSGDDCPINPPRPTCPMAMRLCMTKERCPKYVCCK